MVRTGPLPFSGAGALAEAAGAAAVVDYLAPMRERYNALRADEARLESSFAAGAERARALASVTLADVRAAMGVGSPR